MQSDMNGEPGDERKHVREKNMNGGRQRLKERETMGWTGQH